MANLRRIYNACFHSAEMRWCKLAVNDMEHTYICTYVGGQDGGRSLSHLNCIIIIMN